MCGSAASIPRVARSSNGRIFFTIRTLAFTRLVGIEFRLFHALYFKQSPSRHSSRKISEPVQIKDLSEHEVWKKKRCPHERLLSECVRLESALVRSCNKGF